MIELAQKHDFASLSDDVTRLTFVNDVGHPSTYQQFCTNFHNACEKLPRVRPQAQRRTWNTELSCRLAEMDKQLGTHKAPSALAAQDTNQVAALLLEYSSLLRENPRLAWKNVSASKFRSTTAVFPADSAEERMQCLNAHFTRLFSGDSGPGPPDWGVSAICPTFVTGVFTHEELERAIKTVQNGKAPGMDEIPNEVLRMRELRVHILNVLNDALQHGPPQQWKETLLVPLPKKGDLSDPGNWSGAVSPNAFSWNDQPTKGAF